MAEVHAYTPPLLRGRAVTFSDHQQTKQPPPLFSERSLSLVLLSIKLSFHAI